MRRDRLHLLSGFAVSQDFFFFFWLVQCVLFNVMSETEFRESHFNLAE